MKSLGRIRLDSLGLAFATSIASKIMTAAVQLLAIPLVARALGPEGYGQLVLLAITATLTLLFTQGMSQTASNELAQDYRSPVSVTNKLHDYVITTTLLGVLFVALIPVIVIPLTTSLDFVVASARSKSADRLLYCALALHCFFFITSSWYEGANAALLRSAAVNLINICSSIIIIILVIILANQTENIAIYFIIIYTTRQLGLQVSGILLLKSAKAFPVKFRINKTRFKSICKRCINYSLGTGSINFYMHGMTLIVGGIYGIEMSAIFGALNAIFTVAFSVLSSVLITIIPRVQIAVADDEHAIARNLIVYVVLSIFSAIVSIAIFFGFYGRQILEIYLGIDVIEFEKFNLIASVIGITYISMSAILLCNTALLQNTGLGRKMFLYIVFLISCAYPISLLCGFVSYLAILSFGIFGLILFPELKNLGEFIYVHCMR